MTLHLESLVDSVGQNSLDPTNRGRDNEPVPLGQVDTNVQTVITVFEETMTRVERQEYDEQ